ncbi:MAG: ATP-dependent DNA helicase RecG [Lachnospiraceae bacterium]|nr:ATP-dependent DNA helicase RecG [Lachnospiraceae bacterium]
MERNDSILVVKGVGEKTAKLFSKKKIETIDDLLRYYPKSYQEFKDPICIEDVLLEERVAVMGQICQKPVTRNLTKINITVSKIRDNTGSMEVCWYHMPFLKNFFHMGDTYVFVGEVSKKYGKLVMEQPQYYKVEEYEKQKQTLVPLYSTTQGLSNKLIQKSVKQALEAVTKTEEYLPEYLLERYQLTDVFQATYMMHFPKNKEDVLKARKRLAFDEFFAFLASMEWLKEQEIKRQNENPIKDAVSLVPLLKKLSYELTNAQKQVLDEILKDLQGEYVMNRLVQGDVGSGKTIIAICALFYMLESGYQGALMAPTEVLAKQHYTEVVELFQDLPYQVELLTGSTPAAQKRSCYQNLKEGTTHLVIGTHALLEDKVTFKNLGMVITDEQHRFGVKQREKLSLKGNAPHTLIMSATPIPRTLAIILYGDLDISIVNELPKNRLPIKNCVVGTSYRNTAYDFIKKQVLEGRQAYIICPMVEEGENTELENVTSYQNKLEEYYQNQITVGRLHGKMKPQEKELVMNEFAEGKIQILVSTTVIEVGINVPNATVMMIENAERFGLAQLHQLRGRVGRGIHQSYCIMMYKKDTKETKERLEVLNHSNDGFYIANEDLRLRGPGDFFGIRQSGEFDFKVGDIYNDQEMLRSAKEAVKELKEKGMLKEGMLPGYMSKALIM